MGECDDRIREYCESRRCALCGWVPRMYDTTYSDGSRHLCPQCFKAFSKENPVIYRHYPGFVETDTIDFHPWEGCDAFERDCPLKDGWRYVYASGSEGQGCIMRESEDGTEWYVLWHVKDREIAKELSKAMPPWRPRKPDHPPKHRSRLQTIYIPFSTALCNTFIPPTYYTTQPMATAIG